MSFDYTPDALAGAGFDLTGQARDLRDLEKRIVEVPGARAIRIVDQPGSRVAEHRHEWPILSLFITGDYRKISDAGIERICSPAAVLHAAGAPHASLVGDAGAEQLDIEFDPAWTGLDTRALPPVQCWIGGAVAASARRLAGLWLGGEADAAVLATETRRLLAAGQHHAPERNPDWLAEVTALLDSEMPPATEVIARRLGLHPAWLAHRYRRLTGEGLAETVRRHRVERATALLRGHAEPHAQLAIAAGFCDQSHMIRSFRAVLGRTPGQVAGEIAA